MSNALRRCPERGGPNGVPELAARPDGAGSTKRRASAKPASLKDEMSVATLVDLMYVTQTIQFSAALRVNVLRLRVQSLNEHREH